MTVLGLICKIGGHKIDRRRVWDDGYAFRTNCARCGRPLLRGDHGWREFDSETDDKTGRRQHPRHDEKQ